MTPTAQPPTIQVVTSAEVQPVSLGDVGRQQVLLGEPRGDGSPLLMGVTSVRPGQTSTLIEHESAEIAYVLAGVGWIVTDCSAHPFITGDAILIEANCWHAIRAGEQEVRMLYIFPSRSKPLTRTWR